MFVERQPLGNVGPVQTGQKSLHTGKRALHTVQRPYISVSSANSLAYESCRYISQNNTGLNVFTWKWMKLTMAISSIENSNLNIQIKNWNICTTHNKTHGKISRFSHCATSSFSMRGFAASRRPFRPVQINDSCFTDQSRSHVTQINESCHADRRVMSYRCTSHVS